MLLKSVECSEAPISLAMFTGLSHLLLTKASTGSARVQDEVIDNFTSALVAHLLPLVIFQNLKTTIPASIRLIEPDHQCKTF